MTSPEHGGEEFAIELIDPAQGQAIQRWRFRGTSTVRIGRSPDFEIVTPDPNVSRLHAELRFDDGRWLLVSLGRNGVYLDDFLVDDQPLEHGMVFRLASSGPMLRFVLPDGVADDDRHDNGAGRDTVADDDKFSFLQLDTFKKDEEVRNIVDDESFQRIQAQSRALKSRRQSDAESGEATDDGCRPS